MNNIKITSYQIFSLTTSFTCGSGILVISATAAGLAKQDAWISVLLALLFGLIELLIIYFFWIKYPGITYTDIMTQIFGKWIGSAVSIGFIFFCFLSVSQVVWYLGSFMTIQVMPETPVYVINILFVATIVIALLYGIETIARSYEIFVYFISALFVLSMVMVLPDAKMNNLLPILEKGATPVLKGAFELSSFLIFPMTLFLMVLPVHSDNTARAKKAFFKGYVWGGFLVFISIIFSILVLGSTVTAISQFPVYHLAKSINIGTIFTRLEFIVAGVWIITLLSRGIMYFYAGTVGLAKLLKLSNHKIIILPLGLIILVNSGIVYTDVIAQSDWDSFVWPPFAATFGVLLPLSMVLGFYIKKLFKKNNT